VKRSAQKIVPNLWFDHQAEEAVTFYCAVFDRAKLGHVTHYDEASAEASGQPQGSVLTVEYELDGVAFIGLNGGPAFKSNPSISFCVNCQSKAEVDHFWDKLSEGGEVLMPLDRYPFSERYGWANDRYGVSWQVMLATSQLKRKITPSLLFVGDVCGKAEEAIHYYTSVFRHAETGSFLRYEAGQEPDKEGTLAFADFVLEDQLFAAMDSAHSHDFSFSEGISFAVDCRDQAEVDYYWDQLTADGGKESVCGWLKDKYGVSWQIVPRQLRELFGSDDKEKAARAMKTMLQMKKLDIARLEQAYHSRG